MLRLLTLLFILTFASSAHAMCFRSPGFDFEGQIKAEFSYLICLHNEQNDALNEHADIINAQSRRIADLESELDNLRWALEQLEDRISDLE